jgi:hypothetical protein
VSELKPLDLSPAEVVAMDYGAKQDLLLMIAGRVLQLKQEFITVSGRYAEIKAEIDALKHVSSVIQSALKAEAVT